MGIYNRLIILCFVSLPILTIGYGTNKQNIIKSDTINLYEDDDYDDTLAARAKEIIQLGYKVPDDKLFRRRVKEVFGYEITEKDKKEGVIYLELPPIVEDEPDFLIISTKHRLIDTDIQTDEYYDYRYLKAYNDYIFYRNQEAFSYLQKGSEIFGLLNEFGFWNEEIKRFAINKMLSQPPKEEFSDLYFLSFFGRKGINGTWELRRYVLDAYLSALPTTDNHSPNELTTSKLCRIKEPFDTYINKYLFKEPYKSKYGGNLEEDVAYMIDKIYTKVEQCHYIDMNTMETIGNMYDTYPYLLKHYKKKNYYGYEKLKKYTELYEDMKKRDE